LSWFARLPASPLGGPIAPVNSLACTLAAMGRPIRIAGRGIGELVTATSTLAPLSRRSPVQPPRAGWPGGRAARRRRHHPIRIPPCRRSVRSSPDHPPEIMPQDPRRGSRTTERSDTQPLFRGRAENIGERFESPLGHKSSSSDLRLWLLVVDNV
jgi:hypothetical protein